MGAWTAGLGGVLTILLLALWDGLRAALIHCIQHHLNTMVHIVWVLAIAVAVDKWWTWKRIAILEREKSLKVDELKS